MQIILVNVLTIIIVYLISGKFFPKTLTNITTLPEATASVSHSQIRFSVLAGMVGNLIAISLGEFYTSHYFNSARKVAKIGEKGKVFSLIQAHSVSYAAEFIYVVVIGLVCLVCYSEAKFFGVFLGGLGFLLTPIPHITSLIIAGAATEAQIHCRLSKIDEPCEHLQERVSQIAWAARNYPIHIKLMNVAGLFIASIAAVGAYIYILKLTKFDVFDTRILVGFAMGTGLPYYIKSINTQCI